MTAILDGPSLTFWGSSILGGLVFLLLAAALVFALFLVIRGIVRLVRKILAKTDSLNAHSSEPIKEGANERTGYLHVAWRFGERL